jgi:hypothetical protein
MKKLLIPIILFATIMVWHKEDKKEKTWKLKKNDTTL